MKCVPLTRMYTQKRNQPCCHKLSKENQRWREDCAARAKREGRVYPHSTYKCSRAAKYVVDGGLPMCKTHAQSYVLHHQVNGGK